VPLSGIKSLWIEQSKIVDIIIKQGDKLDSFELIFTEILSQIFLIVNENRILQNDFINQTKRIESLESNNFKNPIFNNDAFTDLIDQSARSKNIIFFNAKSQLITISTVNSIIEKHGFDVKRIGNIKTLPLKNNVEHYHRRF